MNTRNGPSDRIRTCGIVVPNHARYQLRYTRRCELKSRSFPRFTGNRKGGCETSENIIHHPYPTSKENFAIGLISGGFDD